MKTKNAVNHIIVRIDRGEYIMESLIKACKLHGIKAASVSGIGATDDFLCGVFNVETKEYKEIRFVGTYEILSLCGSISTKDGEPYVHVHICASDQNGICVGGHLKDARISVTCEIILSVLDTELERTYADDIGINLFDI